LTKINKRLKKTN